MKFKQYITEEFWKSKKKYDYLPHMDGHIEVFRNPTSSELDDLYKIAYDNGVRLGIDKNNVLYTWVEDVLHDEIEKLFNLKFMIKFEYTKGRDTLYLSSGEKGVHFKNVKKKTLDRMCNIMDFKKIEMVSKPYTVLYERK